MSKPKLETLVKLYEMKEKAIELLEKYNSNINKLTKKYGDSNFEYEIEETDDGEKYVRFSLTDNDVKVANGESVLVFAHYKPAEMKRRFLKRVPESLKKK